MTVIGIGYDLQTCFLNKVGIVKLKSGGAFFKIISCIFFEEGSSCKLNNQTPGRLL